MNDTSLLIIAILSGLGTCLLFYGIVVFGGRVPPSLPDPVEPSARCAFQFENGRMIDASREGDALLSCMEDDQQIEDFAGLAQVLRARFPTFPLSPPVDPCEFRARTTDDSGLARIERKGPYTRVVISDRKFGEADLQKLRSAQAELDILRRAINDAPDPIWEICPKKGVTWANSAYRLLQRRARQTDDSEPLFDVAIPSEGTAQLRRVRIELPDSETPSWYEVATRPAGDVWMCYGTNIDAVVQAETTQRNFVQTLAKTFAHLPTGLAIFDRNRFLALFNPAMVDLTGIPAEFLGSRPNVVSFFDRIREAQVMPEPKNYQNWRERLAELVAAASDDRYCETWSLSSGLTYRVTGRPHPDGAIAFLFEDISAEVSLTRRFRAEMEISQAVLDSFDDAVAVFSQVGVLTMTNAAYRRMWASDPNSSFSELTILDATRLWQKLCEPASVWPELRDFVTVGQERATWDFQLSKRSGERLFCQVDPISAGSTLVRFSALPDARTGDRTGPMRTVA